MTATAELDIPALVARLNGDESLLREIAAIFLDVAPAELAALRSAVASGELRSVREAAHRMRGMLVNFGAETAVGELTALEALERAPAGAASAPHHFARFETALTRLIPELEALARA
jgi:HPt (histidine-containing phosphotransfer) domain-containing protein